MLEETIISIHCGGCGTIYQITDTGERPLHRECPACGAIGTLDVTRVVPRFIRVRCLGCGFVERIEDPRARPFRRQCSGCGQVGRSKDPR